MLQYRFIKLSSIFLYCIGYIFIFILVFNSSGKAVYDEILFYPNINLFEIHGLSKQFLLEYSNQAPGPLYEIVHYSFKWFSDYLFPEMRFVNILFFSGTLVVISFILFQNNETKIIPKTLSVISVPFIWPIIGMALTEMPAIFFMTLFIYVIQLANKTKTIRVFFLFALSAVFLAMAISGRTSFLVFLIIFPIMIFYNYIHNNNNNNILLLLTGVLSILLVSPIFFTWKGLTPPNQIYVGQGFNFIHGILSLAYSYFCVLFLNYRWLVFDKKVITISLFICLLFMFFNLYLNIYSFIPMKSVLENHLPKFIILLIGYIFPSLILLFSILFLYSYSVRIRENFSNINLVCLYIILLLLILSNIKIAHQFSSRYIAQLFPLFVILVSPYYQEKRYLNVFLSFIGIILGLLSLKSYLQINLF